MNTQDYVREAQRQLSDKIFYEKLDSDPTEIFSMEIDNFLQKMVRDKKIAKKTFLYLSPLQYEARFYLLPKIHKGTLPPPGRPIVSAIKSPTERISQFLDHFLQPCFPQIKSYVEDRVPTKISEKSSMTFPWPNQNFQTQNTDINCVNIRFCGSYINLLNQLQIYISILIVTPCLLPWIREFIHAQNCNTMLKTTAIPFIWTKSLYKHSVAWSHRSGKGIGWRWWSLLWRHQLKLTLMTSSVKYAHLYFMVVSQSEVRIWAKHEINIYILT